jgi:DNA-binding transcriptional MerR regulator
VAAERPHGRFLAADAGDLAGVSGTTVGQWARRGYIRSSQSRREPRVYSVEDVAEAAVVGALLRRGVRHAEIRRVIAALADRGDWPLRRARLATTADGRPAHVVLREDDGAYALSDRGWQRLTVVPPLQDVTGWRP